MRKCFLGAVALVVLLSGTSVDASVTLGQSDSFSTSDTLGWTMGFNQIIPPAVVSTGGPQGVSDGYLQIVSTGGGSANSKLVMFNQIQWTGDFIAAGVTRINLDMANFGTNALSMRVAIQDNFGSDFSSTIPVPLAADGHWHSASFDMSPSAFTQTQGSSTATHALSNVGDLRLLSSANPSFFGDTIAATVGFDNITAVPEPGVGGVILAALAVGFRRRR